MQTSYLGPPIDDLALLVRLPDDLVRVLQARNGFVAAEGGLHVRGACINPDWHSLRSAWEGEFALHTLYPALKKEDVPFAEDCFDDQFLIRDGLIVHLNGETGELEETPQTWSEFLSFVEDDPTSFLQLSYLRSFLDTGGALKPGELLSVYPPFVFVQSTDPSLRPCPALELRSFLADFAKQISQVPDGQKVRITVR